MRETRIKRKKHATWLRASEVEVKGFRRNYKREIQGNNNNNNNNNKNNVMKEVAIAHV